MQFGKCFKPIIIVLLICLGLGLLATSTLANVGSSKFSLVQSTQDGVEITFQMADLDLGVEKITTGFGETYDRLSISDGGFLGEVGKPGLPTAGTFLEVPEGASPTMEIIVSEYHDLSGYYIYPAQPSVPEGESAPFVKDVAAYAVDSFYPVQLAQFEEIGQIRTHRTGLLTVCPALYNPIQKKLRVYTKIRIRIQYNFSSTQTRSSSVAPRSSDSPYFEPLYQDLYLNYRQPEIATPTPDLSRSIVDDPNYGCDYLIITHDKFYNSDVLRRLAASKQKRGLKAYIRSLSDIGANPDANQISAYIKNAYRSWRIKPSYILLVGDTEYIPAHYKTWHPAYKKTRTDSEGKVEGNGWIATDLYYSTIDDTDFLPDIFVGRLPVTDEWELNKIVTKILNYEAQFNPVDPWRNQCLMVADASEPDRFIPYSQYAQSYLQGSGYKCDRVYVGSSYSGTTQDIINKINEGVFLVHYRGHGWYGGLGNSVLQYWNCWDLINNNKCPIFFSFTCNTGMYDYEDDCLGETLLLNSSGKGAVSYIGSSRVSYSEYNNAISNCMMKQIKTTAYGLRMGSLLNSGKLEIYTNIYYTRSICKLHYEMYNLLGDPEMIIVQQQSNIPSLSITAPASGASLSKGSTYDIQWSWNTSISQVNLKLYKNGQKIKDIATVPCNGKYSWTVPLNLPDGNDYYIAIEDSRSLITNTSKQFSMVTPEVITKKWETEPYDFKIFDVNNDGFKDIVIPDYRNAIKLLLWNKNSGNWDIEQTLAVDSSLDNVQIADVNNDGYTDIISRGYYSVNIFLWNNNMATWDAKAIPISQLVSIAIGDVNNDGFNDLIIGVSENTATLDPIPTPGNGKLMIFLWDNLRKDWKEPLVQKLDFAYVPLEICIGDATNDGFQDIVVAAQNATIVVLPWDQATGAWKSPVVKPVGQSPYSLMIKDANNDGLNDITVGSWQDYGIHMLLWDKNLADWNPKTIPLEMYSLGYTIGDVNNDGYNDLVTCNRNYKKITEYLWNQQLKELINTKTINLGNSPVTVNVSDINGDGFNDIITGNNPETSFSVILWKEPRSGVVPLPDSNSCWKTGGNYQIIWDSTSVWPGAVIELWKGNVKTREISVVEERVNHWSCYWQVPADIPEGRDYQIKVINPENSSEYGYSYCFEIAKAAIPGTAFQIKAPVVNEQFFGGSICDITWDTLSPVSKVNIGLWKGEQLYREICTVLNTNHYQWRIPEYFTQGDDYRIKISDADSPEQSVYSEYFTIIPPSFTVAGPAAGAELFKGSPFKITWKIVGFQPCNTVSIELWRWGQRFRGIATISNTGEYNWTVPTDLEGEGYSIKVSDTYRYDLEVCGYSETFNIVAPFAFTLIGYPRTAPDQLSYPVVNIGWRWTRLAGYTDGVLIELWEAPSLSDEIIKYWNEKTQAGKLSFSEWEKITDLKLVRQIASYQIPVTRSIVWEYWYRWELPEDLPNMRQCFIKITNLADQTVYGLSPIFAVRFDHQLRVTSPAASQLCLSGPNNGYEVKWQWSGNVPKVNLELWNETDKVRDIAFNVNSGDPFYYWSIPASVPNGSKYRIKISETNDPLSFEFSDYFRIHYPSSLAGNDVIDVEQSQNTGQYLIEEGTGQTFTAGYTGYLNGVELYLQLVDDPMFYIESETNEVRVVIREGVDLNGKILGSSAPLIFDYVLPRWYQFNLENVFLTKGSTYTIEVQGNNSPLYWYGSANNNYNGGFAYVDNIVYTDWDFAFKTHVIPENENKLLDVSQPFYDSNLDTPLNQTALQTFVPGSSGMLSSIKLLLKKPQIIGSNSLAQVFVTVYRYEPDGLSFREQSLPVQVDSAEPQWYEFCFQNLSLTQGNQYTIRLDMVNWNGMAEWCVSAQNPVLDGGAVYNGTVEKQWDFAFKTYVIPGVRINFQPYLTIPSDNLILKVPAGFLPDFGDVYSPRYGLIYGWNTSHADLAAVRDLNPDQRLDTFIGFHQQGVWEMAVPNGSYEVKVGIGDALANSTYSINVEGISFADKTTLNAANFVELKNTVTVTDGTLTLDQGDLGENSTRINYIEIRPLNSDNPTEIKYIMAVTRDGNGSTNLAGLVTVSDGASREITAAPNQGYRFINWTQTGGTGTVTFGNPNSARTTVTVTGGDAMIRANFSLGILGDVNGDGAVTVVDAQLVGQYASGLNPPNFNPILADVNNDGKVTINDALLIARFAAGLITGF